MNKAVRIFVVFVTCLSVQTTIVVGQAPQAPLELETVPSVSSSRLPLGHTVSLPQFGRIAAAPERPAAIQLRVKSLSPVVGNGVVCAAEVHTQHGEPVPDGTSVHFLAGAGKVAAARVATKRGRATTTVTGTQAGPLRLTASCGFVTATAYLHVRTQSSSLGSLIFDDDLKAGPGLATLRGGTFKPGVGIALKGGRRGKQGLRYRTSPLRAGTLTVRLSQVQAPGKAEAFVVLFGTTDGKLVPLVDLRRGRSNGREAWLLRVVGDGGGKQRGTCSAFSRQDSAELELRWQGTTIACRCRDGKGQQRFALTVAGQKPIVVTEILVGGHPTVASPRHLLVERVTVTGR